MDIDANRTCGLATASAGATGVIAGAALLNTMGTEGRVVSLVVAGAAAVEVVGVGRVVLGEAPGVV